MGVGVSATHPKAIGALDRVLDAAKPHGVAVGFPTDDPKQVATLAAKGVRYFEASAPDYLLREAYAERLAALRKCWP
jgi:2-keto-3-deoxy-L-rhamnonate aldolase RhmA